MFNQQQRLIELRERGFNPTNIIDVGANVGQWFNTARWVFPKATILSIEPNPEAYKHLVKVNSNSICVGLGADEGVLDMYVNRNDPKCTGASVYKEQTYHYVDPNIIQIPIKTLDSIGKAFDLIKVDVQGAERDVLVGGINTLKSATFVTLELAVMRYNQGAPLINEMITYMSDNGFLFYDVFEMHYMGNALIQIDVCFVNERHSNLLEL